MEIKNSYLMWVGHAHYKEIKDFTDETAVMGISKRVANANVAQALLEPDTVIFLAHDEGCYEECPKCLGDVECGECRKRNQESVRIQAEMDELGQAYKGITEVKERQALSLKINRRGIKIRKLADVNDNCEVCGGKGKYQAGTGGHIRIDDVWTDYRTYSYWLHQPKNWKPEAYVIRDDSMCGHCGGTGRIPKGQVFGMFMPDGIEYILREGDDEKVKQEMEQRKFKTLYTAAVATEPKRGCGKRKEGGLYVVTRVNVTNVNIKKLVNELVEKGIVKADGVEIDGSVVTFTDPIEINIKRFRGLKKWGLDPRAEEQAEMVIEALEG